MSSTPLSDCVPYFKQSLLAHLQECLTCNLSMSYLSLSVGSVTKEFFAIGQARRPCRRCKYPMPWSVVTPFVDVHVSTSYCFQPPDVCTKGPPLLIPCVKQTRLAKTSFILTGARLV